MAIEALRSDLLKLTENLLELIKERESVVKKVQDLKVASNLTCFDPIREKYIFEEFKDLLIKLSLKELFAVSLIIESQAGEHYPKWSEREHLQTTQNTLIEQINPLMLLQLRKDDFKLLDLKTEIKASLE
tara:strand:- start:6392 stop:6781 length:390 start_codon:yes stop_codon:yes gene_type:complete